MPALCLHNVDAQGAYLAASLFVAGLTGGFTHCAGMCGPFVLAQTAVQPEDRGGVLTRLCATLLVPYHLGRATTYIVMAFLFSGLVSAVFINSDLKTALSAFLLGLAGLVFFVNAIPALAAVFPFLARFPALVPFRVIEKFSAPFMRSPSFAHRYALGLLLGFMPCGLVMAALLAAMAADTPWQAAGAMAAFAAGTVPALFLTAAGGQIIKARWPRLVPKVTAALVLTSGLSLFYIAGTMIL